MVPGMALGTPASPLTEALNRASVPDGAPLWPGVEARHLQALVVVADEGTFSRAAERLGYTQSAVSQQVRALEQMVGATLFDRPGGPRPVTLTPAGEVMIGHARALLARLGEAAAEMQALMAGETGTLRLGSIQSVGRKILPELMRRFRAEFPGVQVKLEESQDAVPLLEHVADGSLDVMVAPLPGSGGHYCNKIIREAGVTGRIILEDAFVLLAPADSPEAELGAVSLEDLVQLPLIGYRSDWCRSIAVDRLSAASREPNFVFETDDNPTMQGLVGAGEGYAFTTRLSVDEADPKVRLVEINPPVARRELAVLRPEGRTPPPALDAFVEMAEKVVVDLGLGVDWEFPEDVS
jgi:DNA-binding transcriptional LysR family regulator